MNIDQDYYNCGGENVYFSLYDQQNNCSSEVKRNFNLGKTLIWQKKDLGECKKFIQEINENQKVVLKVQSDSYDKFCPKNVYVHPDNGIQFNYKMKSEWYSKQTNNYVHFATIEIEKHNYIHGIACYYNLVIYIVSRNFELI